MSCCTGSARTASSSPRDYALWTPRWLIERFVDFQIPEELGEYAPITTEQKKKILGLNAAKMYDIPVPEELQLPAGGRARGRTARRRQDRGIRRPSGGGLRCAGTTSASEAYAALGTVIDPELDEPITDLGFVHSLVVTAAAT